MLKVENIKDYSGGIEKAIQYYFNAWGKETNYSFFYDAMINSSKEGKKLPRFFVLTKDDEIIGCCGLIVNDFISRHDLFPWLAGVYISENERGNEYANLIMSHAENEAKLAGFNQLYLTTDHDGFYEKYKWERIEDGYDISGCSTRIYTKTL